MEKVFEWIEEHFEEGLADLIEFGHQPSISAQGVGMEEAVEKLAELLRKYGVEPQVFPISSYPAVYGEALGDSPFTLLLYNHYDVQPPEPLELWSSPPFQPEIREGKVFGRGVADDKGDIVSRLLALRAFQEVRGSLPVKIKFLIEGAEEIGSPGLSQFIEEHRELLRADACIWESGEVGWEDRPLICLGAKGILYVELKVEGANRDVHSSMATIVPNPAWRLISALSTLKDPRGNVLIEGFYDEVVPPTPEELAAIQALPSEEEELKESLGLKGFVQGLQGEELKRHHLLEPTCNICGLLSGYTGEGSKTVLPSFASAKLDFRLVPQQRPEDILEKLKRHLEKHGFADVSITCHEGELPARTPLNSPLVGLMAEAARMVYGAEPLIVPTFAGTGPMFPFREVLGLPVASLGVSYPESRAHAPDENIRLADFIRATKYLAAILDRCGRSELT